MTIKYEVWSKKKLGQGRTLPESTFYTPDSAILEANKLSNGEEEVMEWNDKTFAEERYMVKLMFAVLIRDKVSSIRGWSIGGKYYQANDCARCQNTGVDQTSWRLPCRACSGSSYRPKL